MIFIRGAPDESGSYAISQEDDLYLVGPDGAAVAILDDRAGMDGPVAQIQKHMSAPAVDAGQSEGQP
ncbi:MAG: hypothetical protein GY725_08680 [bacterium]|nr:hypothetical protein [bacterium]